MLLIYQKNIILFNQIYPLLSQGAKKIKIPIIDTSDFPAIAQKIGVYEKNTDEKNIHIQTVGYFIYLKGPICFVLWQEVITVLYQTTQEKYQK